MSIEDCIASGVKTTFPVCGGLLICDKRFLAQLSMAVVKFFLKRIFVGYVSAKLHIFVFLAMHLPAAYLINLPHMFAFVVVNDM